MTKTVFQNEDISIEEAPKTKGALVKAASEVLIHAPSEMNVEEVAADSEATNVAVDEYKSKFDQLLLSIIGSSVATGANVFQAIKNDGTLYRLVSNTKLETIGNNQYRPYERGANGTFKKQATFAKAGGTTAAVASQVFAQGMLIHIAIQLDELRSLVQTIRNDSFKDACNNLKGTIEAMDIGIRNFKSLGNRELLANPLNDFPSSFDVLYGKVRDRMCDIQTKPKFLENWHLWGKGFQGGIEQECMLICSALGWLFTSIQIAVKGYSIFNPGIGISEARKRFDEMNTLDYSRLLDALRILPYDNHWKAFENDVFEISNKLPLLVEGFGKRPVLVMTGKELRSVKENS